MACPRCGATSPETSAGGLCNYCRDQMSMENAQSNNNSSSSKRSTASDIPMNSSTATAICIILAIVLVVGAFFLVRGIYNSHADNMAMEVFTENLDGDGSALISEILAREDNTTNWEISVTSYKKGFFGTLFGLTGDGARIKRYLQKDGTEVISFNFDGDDLGTGLDGKYYILTIEGKISVIDDKSELIYREGSEFFDANYPKLRELTYDAILSVLSENLVGGRYGKNDRYEHILQTDNRQMMVYDKNRVIFTINNEDQYIRYVADVSNKESNYTFEMLNYKLHDETYEGLDELGKLMADGDYSVSIEKYIDDKEVFDLRYERNLKQHSIEFREDYGDFKKGIYYFTIGEDAFVHKAYNDETYKLDETALSVTKDKALYDTLISFVPEIYVRNVVDLGKAEKSGALGVTTYTMKDGDGKTVAILSVAFGKINKLIHFVTEGERIEMAW